MPSFFSVLRSRYFLALWFWVLAASSKPALAGVTPTENEGTKRTYSSSDRGQSNTSRDNLSNEYVPFWKLTGTAVGLVIMVYHVYCKYLFDEKLCNGWCDWGTSFLFPYISCFGQKGLSKIGMLTLSEGFKESWDKAKLFAPIFFHAYGAPLFQWVGFFLLECICPKSWHWMELGRDEDIYHPFALIYNLKDVLAFALSVYTCHENIPFALGCFLFNFCRVYDHGKFPYIRYLYNPSTLDKQQLERVSFRLSLYGSLAAIDYGFFLLNIFFGPLTMVAFTASLCYA